MQTHEIKIIVVDNEAKTFEIETSRGTLDIPLLEPHQMSDVISSLLECIEHEGSLTDEPVASCIVYDKKSKRVGVAAYNV